MNRPQPLMTEAQVANTATLYYTSPAGTRTTISRLTLCNTTASSCWISVWKVSSGGSAADGTKFTQEKAVLPGETWTDPHLIGHNLHPGDMIYMQAQTASALTAHLSGTLTA